MPAVVAPAVTTGVTELTTTLGVRSTDNIIADKRVMSYAGFEINGKTNNDIVLASGGTKPLSDFQNNYVDQIITTNGATLGTTYSFKRIGLSDLTMQLTVASDLFSGVVTTDSQKFAGNKDNSGTWSWKPNTYYNSGVDRMYITRTSDGSKNYLGGRNADGNERIVVYGSGANAGGYQLLLYDGGVFSLGFAINGRTNSDILLAGGGYRPVSDFALTNDSRIVNGQTAFNERITQFNTTYTTSVYTFSILLANGVQKQTTLQVSTTHFVINSSGVLQLNSAIAQKINDAATVAYVDSKVAAIPSPNNGSFVVQGVNDLTGAGSTSADASNNSVATLDLSQNAKNRIQQGVNASFEVNMLKEHVEEHFVNTPNSYNIPIKGRKTIVTLSAGIIGANIHIEDAPYVGYSLAINGCGEWRADVDGQIKNTCQDSGSFSITKNSLFWWDGGKWAQAI